MCLFQMPNVDLKKKVAVPTVVSPRICFNGNGSNVPSCSKTDRQTVVLISYG